MSVARATWHRDRFGHVTLASLALAAVVLSRYVLRSERLLAALPTAWLPGAVVGVAAVWLIAHATKAARRGVPFELSGVELGLMSWIVCCSIATIAFARAPFWMYALVPYLTLGGAFVLARRFADRTTVRVVLAVTGGIVAASVLLDAVGLAVVMPQRRPGGLLGNRNFAGEYIALALPAALVVFSRARRWMPVLVLFGVALALTRCRSAWIAAGIATAAVVVLSSSSTRWRRGLGAMIVLAGALLAGNVPAKLGWSEPHPFTATLSRLVDLQSGSGELRVHQYAVTMRVLDTRDAWWTGLGMGRWQAAVRAEDRALARNRIPHSDYLRTLSDGGVPALVAMCAMLLAAAGVAWRARTDSPDMFAFVGALALVAAADAPLFRPEIVVVTAAVLGTLQARAPRAGGISCLEPAPSEPV